MAIFGDFFHDLKNPRARQTNGVPQSAPIATRFGTGAHDPNPRPKEEHHPYRRQTFFDDYL